MVRCQQIVPGAPSTGWGRGSCKALQEMMLTHRTNGAMIVPSLATPAGIVSICQNSEMSSYYNPGRHIWSTLDSPLQCYMPKQTSEVVVVNVSV